MKLSWVDHILSTMSLDSVIGDVYILDDVIVSDHKPVSFCLDCNVCVKVTASTDTQEGNVSWLPCWQQCDETTIMNYKYRLDSLLQEVDVPWYLISDLHVNCDKSIIDEFYKEVLSRVSLAMYDSIPVQSSFNHFNVRVGIHMLRI